MVLTGFPGEFYPFTNYIGFYITVTYPFYGLGLKPDNLLLGVHEGFLIQNIGTIASKITEKWETT